MPEFGFALPLLEAIVSYIDEGVLIANQNDDVIYMNPAAHQLLALPPNSAITSLADVPGIDLAGVMVAAADAPARRAGTAVERVLNVDGERRSLQFDCSRTTPAHGGLQLFIIRDVSQQRLLETYLNRASSDLITADPKMMEILHRVEQVASASVPVLLTGELGTGKTHIARMIHRLSPRSTGPFVEVNCAAIPELLVELELFGHIKGAFTGATQRRKGRFQTAAQGHAVSRRDRRDPHSSAGQAVARAAGPRVRAGGLGRAGEGRRAHHRLDQPAICARWSIRARSAAISITGWR